MPQLLQHSFGNLLARGATPLSNEQSRDIVTMLIWLVLASVVLGIIFWIIRRQYAKTDDAGESFGYTLADMRQLHEEGKLSDEEFAQAKRQMVAQGRKMLDPDLNAESDTAANLGEIKALEATGNPVDNGPGDDEASDKIDAEPDRPV